jgi:glycerate 2-kinase
MNAAAVEHARETVEKLFGAALSAVNPARAVADALLWDGGELKVAEARMPVGAGIHIIAVGKAAMAMTRGVLDRLDGAIASGDVITKVGHVEGTLPERIRVHEAAHPVLDERSIIATQKALEGLRQLPEDTLVMALISGGGSALLEAPQDDLTLEDFATTTDLLLRAGAPIDALNAVRAQLSRVKAGGLRAAAPKSRWVTLILSDVLGNDPRIIASGPTVPGRNDPQLALNIIDRFGLRASIPPPVIAYLEHTVDRELPPTFADDFVEFIGDNAMAVRAAAMAAEALGLTAQVIWHAVEGEAAVLGRAFVGEAINARDGVDVLLGGGEATVTVRGSGVGGRNTEFALAAALEMERRDVDDWVVASLGTDGQDALTGLAGAIADPWTGCRCRTLGLDPQEALANNDSATVFRMAGGAVETGPTGTNVNDLFIAVRLRAIAIDGTGG